MRTQNEFSDEIVNAYVDGELGADERLNLLRAASDSGVLAQRLCQAGYLKEALKETYRNPEGAPGVRRTSPVRFAGRWAGYAAARPYRAAACALPR